MSMTSWAQAAYFTYPYDTARLAITWTLTSVTLLSLVLRVTIRLRRFRKLFWDDFSVGLAFVLSLATAIEPTFTAVHYDFGDDPGIKQGKVVVILSIMYNTCLWAVKIAFLLFFKRLGVDTIRNLRVYWWLVLVTTVLSYGALYTMSQERCIWTHGLAKPDCSLELKARRLGYTAVKVACALDVGTDLLIMSIPFCILYRIRLSMRQRAILSALFSLTFITIVVAIVRVVLSLPRITAPFDGGLVLLLSHLETNIAIMIACVGSFRAFFTDQSKRQHPNDQDAQKRHRCGWKSKDGIDGLDLPSFLGDKSEPPMAPRNGEPWIREITIVPTAHI